MEVRGERPNDERILPLVLGLLYAPSFAALISSETYGGAAYWPLWALPWLLILAGYFHLRYWGAGETALRSSPTSTSRALCPRTETDRAGTFP